MFLNNNFMAKNKELQAKYKEEGKKRMILRKKARLAKYIQNVQNPPWWKRRFICEMGYSECERRGHCNGDC